MPKVELHVHLEGATSPQAIFRMAERNGISLPAADLESWDKQGNQAWKLAWRAYVYGRWGKRAEAEQALEDLRQIYKREDISPDPMIWACLGMGNRDEVFRWFEKAYADHSNLLTTLKVHPAYDGLRDDPRFKELMRRVRLAE